MNIELEERMKQIQDHDQEMATRGRKRYSNDGRLYAPISFSYILDTNLTTTEFRLIAILHAFSIGSNVAFPSQDFLAGLLNVSRRQVVRLLMSLEKKGYVEKLKTVGKSCTYVLIDIECNYSFLKDHHFYNHEVSIRKHQSLSYFLGRKGEFQTDINNALNKEIEENDANNSKEDFLMGETLMSQTHAHIEGTSDETLGTHKEIISFKENILRKNKEENPYRDLEAPSGPKPTVFGNSKNNSFEENGPTRSDKKDYALDCTKTDTKKHSVKDIVNKAKSKTNKSVVKRNAKKAQKMQKCGASVLQTARPESMVAKKNCDSLYGIYVDSMLEYFGRDLSNRKLTIADKSKLKKMIEVFSYETMERVIKFTCFSWGDLNKVFPYKDMARPTINIFCTTKHVDDLCERMEITKNELLQNRSKQDSNKNSRKQELANKLGVQRPSDTISKKEKYAKMLGVKKGS